jgi:hypothetical protein
MALEHPESIEPRHSAPEASHGRVLGRLGVSTIHAVAALVVIVGVVSSLLLDGGLTRIADLGGGVGAGLVPVLVVGVPASIAFLILGVMSPSGEPQERRSAVSLEDLPPLIDVARRTAHTSAK